MLSFERTRRKERKFFPLYNISIHKYVYIRIHIFITSKYEVRVLYTLYSMRTQMLRNINSRLVVISIYYTFLLLLSFYKIFFIFSFLKA